MSDPEFPGEEVAAVTNAADDQVAVERLHEFLSVQKAALTIPLTVVAVPVPNRLLSKVPKPVKAHFLSVRAQKPIVSCPDRTDAKLVLFDPSSVPSPTLAAPADWALFPADVADALRPLACGPPAPFSLAVGYDNMTSQEVLRAVLPDGVDAPAAFETIGHIAHLNLRDEVLPWRLVIGHVLADKHANIELVVNKTGNIASQFRVFPMEILAGPAEPVFTATVREGGVEFDVDVTRVYWNSRLSREHERIVDLLPPTATVADLFCGVGPFAVPAAVKGCTVYANDLNPASVRLLKVNAARALPPPHPGQKRPAERGTVHTNCGDARAYARELVATGVVYDYAVMNLPALAETFLDCFVGLFPHAVYQRLPFVFVHCFTRLEGPAAVEDVLVRSAAALGVPREALDPAATAVDVRLVAPRKRMMCVQMRLPKVCWADEASQA
jgi:tRNA (guanine37-N1)-methyltransferase